MLKRKLACPECGAHLKTENLPPARTKVRCPQCQAQFRMPKLESLEVIAPEAVRAPSGAVPQAIIPPQSSGEQVRTAAWLNLKTLLVGGTMLALGVVIAVPVVHKFLGRQETSRAGAEQRQTPAAISGISGKLSSPSGITTMSPGNVSGGGSTSMASIPEIQVPPSLAQDNRAASQSSPTVESVEKQANGDSTGDSDSTPKNSQLASGPKSAPENPNPVGEEQKVVGQKLDTPAPTAPRVLPSTAGEPVILSGHRSAVVSLVFSPDDAKLASVTVDGSTNLWDMETDHVVSVSGPKGKDPIRTELSLNFSPDGKLLVYGGGREYRGYDLASGQDHAKFGEAKKGHYSLIVSRDGGRVATASTEYRHIAGQQVPYTVYTVWDVISGNSLATFEVSRGSKKSGAAFSPGGDMFAVASQNDIHFYDVADQKELPAISGLPAEVDQVMFTPEGQHLLCTVSKNIYSWRIQRGIAAQLVQQEKVDILQRLLLSPDGETVAVVQFDGQVVLRDAKSLKPRTAFQAQVDSKGACGFSADGKSFAATDGNHLGIWDVRTGRKTDLFDMQGELVTALAFSHNGKLLATSGWTGTIKLWAVATQSVRRREPLATFRTKNAPKVSTQVGEPWNYVVLVGFSPDSRWLLTQDVRGSVNVWSVDGTPKLRSVLPEAMKLRGGPWAMLPDGKRLVTFGGNSSSEYSGLTFWDLSAGKPLQTSSGRQSTQRDTAYRVSPDGKLIAVAAIEGTSEVRTIVRLLDSVTLKQKASVPIERAANVRMLAISADGRMMAASTGSDKVRIWNIEKLSDITEQPTMATGGDGRVLEFIDGGATLVTANHKEASLWDVGTGQARNSIEIGRAHSRGLGAVAFSPDSSSFVTLGENGEVFLRDRKTGDVREILADGSVAWSGEKSIAVSPDGKVIAAGLAGQTVAIWKLDQDNNEEKPAEAPGPSLTPRTATDDEENREKRKGAGTSGNNSASPTERNGGRGSDDSRSEPPHAVGNKGILSADLSSAGAVSFSPDGKSLAAIGRSGEVKLWDVATGRERELLPGDAERNAIVFAFGGSQVASASGQSVTIHEKDSGKLIRHLELADRISGLATSRSGTVLAIANGDSVALWDILGENKPLVLAVGNAVSCVAMSHDGNTVAVGSKANFTLWDVKTGRQRFARPFLKGTFVSMAFSWDDTMLAVTLGEGSREVKVIDVGTATLSQVSVTNLMRGTAPTGARKLAFSSTGLLAVGYESTVVLVDLKRGREIGRRAQTVAADLAFSTDGSTLAVAGGPVWDLGLLVPPAPQKVLELGRAARAVAFSPDGRVLAGAGTSAMQKGELKLWILEPPGKSDGVVVARDDKEGPKGREVFVTSLNGVAFSPDGKLVSAVEGPAVHFWELPSRKKLPTWRGGDRLSSVIFSRDGELLVAGGFGAAFVLERDSGKSHTIRNAPCQMASLSADKTLLACFGDWKVSVVSVATGANQLSLTKGVFGAASSPEGDRLVIGLDESTGYGWLGPQKLKLLNFATLETDKEFSYTLPPETRSIVANYGVSRTIAFNGSTLAVALTEQQGAREVKTVRLFDATTGELKQFLWTEEPKIIYAVALSPNDKIVALAGSDQRETGRVWLWNIER